MNIYLHLHSHYVNNRNHKTQSVATQWNMCWTRAHARWHYYIYSATGSSS